METVVHIYNSIASKRLTSGSELLKRLSEACWFRRYRGIENLARFGVSRAWWKLGSCIGRW